MASITVQLDQTLESELAQLANARHQSPAEVAVEAIANYVARESWEREHIRKGLAELEAGVGVSDESVSAWLDSWGSENELPAPR
jgi:predicted transcriptional regulator